MRKTDKQASVRKYKIYYNWRENNGACFLHSQADFEIREAKTPSQAARDFYGGWISKNNGYKITAIEHLSDPIKPDFHPVKWANKNW